MTFGFETTAPVEMVARILARMEELQDLKNKAERIWKDRSFEGICTE